jgi:hypothetical protein
MIFPALGSMYNDENHKDILGRMEASYAQAITIKLSYWSEADLDWRFYVGDQTVFSSYWGNVPGTMKRTFTFNRIKRIVNMVSGNQRKNRKQTVVIPEENGDSETADQFSKIIQQIYHTNMAHETFSGAFQDSLVSGLSFLQVWNDFRNDPISGDIKVSKADYNSFVVDPYWRNPDMSDCNFMWKRSYLTKRDIISLFPSASDKIAGLYGEVLRDGKFQFLPETYGYAIKILLTYDEFDYRDYREQMVLVDKQTGEVQEWRGQDDERLKMFLATYPQVTMIKQTIPTVKLAIVAQGRVLYDDYNPLGIDQYPFVPVLTYYTPQVPYFPFRLQGMVRGLRDAQYLYSRRKVIELDILESQINSGWIYKENALVNPADVFNLTGQGKGLCLKEEAQMTDVQQIQSPAIPPTTIQLSEIMGKEMNEISGINEELLGNASQDVAGFLATQRANASLVTLQNLFDQLDQSQKQLGKLLIDVIQANYTPGKVKKILEGKEPTQQFYNKAFGKYNAHVEEAVLTQTQKQLQFMQLLQLREVGVEIPNDVLIESCTLTNKNELLESMAKAQQQKQQMEQQAQQLQMAQIQAQIKLTEAQATANDGLGIERLSRVQENEALAQERRAEAVRDENAALLDLVKAMKEIDGIDLQHMQQLLAMHAIVKGQEQQNAQAAQTVQPTSTKRPVSTPRRSRTEATGSPVKETMYEK